MNRIGKALQKFTPREQRWIATILSQLSSGDTKRLDIKKLKGRSDIFRIRRGDVRIIYLQDKDGKIFILTIARRSSTTYRK